MCKWQLVCSGCKCVSSKRKIMRAKYVEIKRITRESYDQVDKFLEKHKLPILTQINMESLNRPLTKKESELLILWGVE